MTETARHDGQTVRGRAEDQAHESAHDHGRHGPGQVAPRSRGEQAAKNNQAPCVELTYNWDAEDYGGARNFGHLAYEVDDIYAACQRLKDAGVTINRPPRDGHMAFIRSPDGISIELLQKGGSLPPQEPWASMQNTGAW